MLEPLKIFFYCQGQQVGTLISCTLPLKGQSIHVHGLRVEGGAGTMKSEHYIIGKIVWELENGTVKEYRQHMSYLQKNNTTI